MKKEDLQDFDIVITRANKSYFVYRSCLIPIVDSVGCSLYLAMYNDDLLRQDEVKDHDIMKVLRYYSVAQAFNLSTFMKAVLNQHASIQYSIIFERKEFTEVTMDEIAKKFGIPVKQLKIKR